MSKADWWEYYELAETVLGLPEGTDEDVVEEALVDDLGVDFDQFCTVAEQLLSLTPPIKTALGGRAVNAFFKPVEGGFIAVIQQDYCNEKKTNEQEQG